MASGKNIRDNVRRERGTIMNEIKWTNGALYKDLESGYTFQVEDNRNLRCVDTGQLAHEVLTLS